MSGYQSGGGRPPYGGGTHGSQPNYDFRCIDRHGHRTYPSEANWRHSRAPRGMQEAHPSGMLADEPPIVFQQPATPLFVSNFIKTSEKHPMVAPRNVGDQTRCVECVYCHKHIIVKIDDSSTAAYVHARWCPACIYKWNINVTDETTHELAMHMFGTPCRNCGMPHGQCTCTCTKCDECPYICKCDGSSFRTYVPESSKFCEEPAEIYACDALPGDCEGKIERGRWYKVTTTSGAEWYSHSKYPLERYAYTEDLTNKRLRPIFTADGDSFNCCAFCHRCILLGDAIYYNVDKHLRACIKCIQYLDITQCDVGEPHLISRCLLEKHQIDHRFTHRLGLFFEAPCTACGAVAGLCTCTCAECLQCPTICKCANSRVKCSAQCKSDKCNWCGRVDCASCNACVCKCGDCCKPVKLCLCELAKLSRKDPTESHTNLSKRTRDVQCAICSVVITIPQYNGKFASFIYARVCNSCGQKHGMLDSKLIPTSLHADGYALLKSNMFGGKQCRMCGVLDGHCICKCTTCWECSFTCKCEKTMFTTNSTCGKCPSPLQRCLCGTVLVCDACDDLANASHGHKCKLCPNQRTCPCETGSRDHVSTCPMLQPDA
jgi:hypothetical protein